MYINHILKLQLHTQYTEQSHILWQFEKAIVISPCRFWHVQTTYRHLQHRGVFTIPVFRTSLIYILHQVRINTNRNEGLLATDSN